MAEKILVTGGTGFIGGWCIAEALKRGYGVRTSVRSLDKAPAVRAAIASVAPGAEGIEFVAADLLADEGWDEAVAGCDYVLHVASPLGGAAGREETIAAARDGALRVLRAAVKAKVKRVVMTSAAAAARPPLSSGRTSDETIWADPDDPQFDTYRVSKILAEKAAWDFMARAGGETALTTILPGAVFGPVLTRDYGSVSIIDGLLRGQPAGLPRIAFWVTDVRDLADLHLRAMIAPEAAGERFIGAGHLMWMREVARVLREGLGAQGARVPTGELPDLIARALALFVPQLRLLTPILGRQFPLTNEKARVQLGFSPRPAGETLVECAQSLLARRGG